MNNEKDYLQVVYSEMGKPITTYPKKLTNYLTQRYSLPKKGALLEIGCGRGEFLRGFMDNGLNGYGVDIAPSAGGYAPGAELKISNVENDGIPYPDNFFDVVYTKSVIEHFYYPERMMQEAYRVLKPGGVIITLCPAWEFNFRIYFEDYTHRTPFMIQSLQDIHLICGFRDVKVEYFRQLPSTWGLFRSPSILISNFSRIFFPDFLKKKSKWIRFSKEIMLLSSACK